MKREKLVLAYSGGLDTSVLVHWLTSEGYDVIALCLDLGQQVEDLEAIRDKGHKAGAVEVLLENVQEEFVRDFVVPAIQWNAIYEGSYLLGTSLARPLIAKKQNFFHNINHGNPEDDKVEYIEDCFEDMDRPKFGWSVKVT
ncbi:MAG: argininosuccinate synthase domain-containing protein, partial [SAR324 cluster bacterium]|nr:argininosuccinate synthase domain-containing protein [SAR324 cluster bacterium]